MKNYEKPAQFVAFSSRHLKTPKKIESNGVASIPLLRYPITPKLCRPWPTWRPNMITKQSTNVAGCTRWTNGEFRHFWPRKYCGGLLGLGWAFRRSWLEGASQVVICLERLEYAKICGKWLTFTTSTKQIGWYYKPLTQKRKGEVRSSRFTRRLEYKIVPRPWKIVQTLIEIPIHKKHRKCIRNPTTNNFQKTTQLQSHLLFCN